MSSKKIAHWGQKNGTMCVTVNYLALITVCAKS